MKKTNLKSILSLALLALVTACSSTTKVTEPIIVVKETVIIEETTTPSFKNCDNCSNPQELRTYFNSINYDKLPKTDKLILQKINKGLFKTNDVNLKKDVFFKSIYPLAYQVNKEIEKEKKDLEKGKNLEALKKKYKSNDIADLKVRINTIPIPMIMAQAAIESAYGTSRFAEEGNALFGQWTTDPNGMTPREKPNSKWKVARYNTPLDSTRGYALNVNTNGTYRKLRKLRAEGKDPIDGLDKYSQKGAEYINIVNSVIKNNNLDKY